MELKDKYFIAIYTNEVKDYAKEKFFTPLFSYTQGGIVDNSTNPDYYKDLQKITNLPVYHLSIPYAPRATLFQRNVAESVSYLRDLFLKTDCEYFLVLESDVIVSPTFLEDINNSLSKLPENWGALGCLYYEGFHDYAKDGLHQTNHVLSGATVYKRAAIEKYPFRWSEENLGAFPDAWWSIDAGTEFSLWNNHDIKFEHLHTTHGTRYSKDL